MRRLLDAVSRLSRWAKLTILAVLIAAIALGIRQYRATDPAPSPTIDRNPQFRAAEAQLRSDPEIADIVYVSVNDQWNATPITAVGDPKDFGRYVCFELGSAGVVGPRTSVRVIDAAKLAANGFDYPAAATAMVPCAQGGQQ